MREAEVTLPRVVKPHPSLGVPKDAIPGRHVLVPESSSPHRGTDLQTASEESQDERRAQNHAS